MTVEHPTQDLANPGALNVSYYTPAQVPASGTIVVQEETVPRLFQPLQIRDLKLHNRIIVSPMCQYSADETLSQPNAWHMGHLGGIWTRAGPGLTIMEATAVEARGRITPQDLGLWSDEQIPAYATLTEFAHSQNLKIAVQLAHAGRKASTIAPWIQRAAVAPKGNGGWADNVVGPDGGDEGMWDSNHAVPKALTTTEVGNLVHLYQAAAIRAVKAGFDVIEIHAAHGYLISSFLSPITNHRTDKYGGSFSNRVRALTEIVTAVRKVIPEGMPLFVRVSASDLIEHTFATPEEAEIGSWTVKQTAELALLLSELGVDLIDVSSGGNHPQQKFTDQIPFAEFVRREVQTRSAHTMLVGAVGGITTGKRAEEILSHGKSDVVFAARAFQRNPALVWTWANELGVRVKTSKQIEWTIKGKI